ncbi:hypothetical protein ACIBEJ_34140 [Nonomuraea sp. NPDC050790]|uniref:hypothetical protein n=1 Tax=Nonomuraea sp. NPDC050790 TaxID=3364371 RepID=UPI0037A55043
MAISDLRQQWALHRKRLVKAAGISQVGFQCHRDTWEFIRYHTGPVQIKYHQLPATAVIRLALSGPDVVAILAKMRGVQILYRFGRSRAIATRVYEAIAETVDTVDPKARPGEAVPDIVLDDKVGPPDGAQA